MSLPKGRRFSRAGKQSLEAMDFFKKAASSFGGDSKDSDLMKQAQGLFGQSSSTETPAPAAPAQSGDAPATTADPPAASKGYSEVYGSAQVLYQGIQDKLSGKEDVDDKKLAVAAEDVLKAAESSGYLGKDNQYGDYFKKAETYLHNYGTKSATPAPEIPDKEDKPAS